MFKIEFAIDTNFIVLIPAMNINLHTKSFEFEFLVFALYIDFKVYDKVNNKPIDGKALEALNLAERKNAKNETKLPNRK